eukprot:3498620-Alexandrium_andersonii.AAC.1
MPWPPVWAGATTCFGASASVARSASCSLRSGPSVRPRPSARPLGLLTASSIAMTLGSGTSRRAPAIVT